MPLTRRRFLSTTAAGAGIVMVHPFAARAQAGQAHLRIAETTDLHVHVWHGGTDISIRPEAAGLPTGVTAMADAGSAGEASFHGLREYVIDQRPETIKAFVNIGSIGLVACNRVPELIDTRFIDIDRLVTVGKAKITESLSGLQRIAGPAGDLALAAAARFDRHQ